MLTKFQTKTGYTCPSASRWMFHRYTSGWSVQQQSSDSWHFFSRHITVVILVTICSPLKAFNVPAYFWSLNDEMTFQMSKFIVFIMPTKSSATIWSKTFNSKANRSLRLLRLWSIKLFCSKTIRKSLRNYSFAFFPVLLQWVEIVFGGSSLRNFLIWKLSYRNGLFISLNCSTILRLVWLWKQFRWKAV